MSSVKKSLYLSYDGMTDPLGQSQVLPYLKALSKNNIEFTLISFEKKHNLEKYRSIIQGLCDESNIRWKPFIYTKKPPLLSTIYDIYRLIQTSSTLVSKEHYDVVHCRSYLSALAGIKLKKNHGLKFIFDMRGFWADERVDGNLWNLKNPIYKMVYSFFKKKEIAFLSDADYTISLTEAGKNEMLNWEGAEKFGPIKVIPCCADLAHFSTNNIDQELLRTLKIKYQLHEKDFVLSYLGSIGTWYMLEEMLLFFKELKKKYSSARFLFITTDDPDYILAKAKSLGIDTDLFIIRSATRKEVPTLLALSTLNIFFIKPAYSKKSSSPTKQGEVMSMGIPIVCNDHVGDTGEIIRKTGSGIVLDNFSSSEFRACIENIDSTLSIPAAHIAKGAKDYFSLKKGVHSYKEIYTKILND